jgi:hypothetical protein
MLRRRPSRRQVLWAIGAACFLVALSVFIYLSYALPWNWTGFPRQRLFDWMQILVIPAAVAIGIFALNRAAQRRDDLKHVPHPGLFAHHDGQIHGHRRHITERREARGGIGIRRPLVQLEGGDRPAL